MRIFEERQRFNQWWLFVIFTLVLLIFMGGIYKTSEGFQYFDNPVVYILLLAGILPLVFMLSLQLETRIYPEGIKVKFSNLPFTKKFFPWKEIKDCYVRNYSPIAEYGGWGIRGLRRKRAYNVAGDIGIQIVTHDDHRFLIGTQKAEAARAVLKNYQHKVNRNTQNKNEIQDL